MSRVAIARSFGYDLRSLRRVLRNILDHLDPPLSSIVKTSDKVLLKVNMGCSGMRDPAVRLTTHPAIAEVIIESILDCGGRVSFGDDVARSGVHGVSICKLTGMAAVAARTGARLVDFVQAGARETPSGLRCPASYLVTNAYFEADKVVNAANCRSGPAIVGMSGAIKNMFGCVVGKRKAQIHNLFGPDAKRFGRAIADIHRVVRADLSFLDLTTVMEGFGVAPAIQPVGLFLASVDPVALDALAASVIGYDVLPMWTTYYAGRFGLGSSDLRRIRTAGLCLEEIERRPLLLPASCDARESVWQRTSRLLNNTVLRPRPTIEAGVCSGCGECARRCPRQCITGRSTGVYAIDLHGCADCECCVKVCPSNAVRLDYIGAVAAIRRLFSRQS